MDLRGILKTRFQKGTVSLPISIEIRGILAHFESARRALSNGASFIETRDDCNPIMICSKVLLIKTPIRFGAKNRASLMGEKSPPPLSEHR